MNKSDLAAYSGDYADGTLVTIVREPRGWFDSTRRYQESHKDVARAMSTWSRSTRSSLRARERYGDRVLIVSFEQLVLETEPMMRSLAQQLGLTFTDELLVPTFNGQPIRADSSRPVYRYGVVEDRAAVPKLESQTEAAILLATDELYARARSVFLEP